MREIKFRGKTEVSNLLVYGNLLQNEEGTFIVSDSEIECCDNETADLFATAWDKVMPSTVCQYTGLKDKNDKEIFEGDIVKYHMWSKNLIVKYNIYSCAFCAVVDNYAYPIRTVDELEVIGNIYDNPELLEAQPNDR